MSEAFRLFVYGQLRRGQIGHERLGLEQRTKWLGPAGVQGRLYDFGDYPGLILGGSNIVYGELLGFDDPALWIVLDAYEEFDTENPDLSEFRRGVVKILGHGITACVYVYNQTLEGKRRIDGFKYPLR